MDHIIRAWLDDGTETHIPKYYERYIKNPKNLAITIANWQWAHRSEIVERIQIGDIVYYLDADVTFYISQEEFYISQEEEANDKGAEDANSK